MTAFKQVLSNLQAGQREEALIGLEFVLRLDPSFVPANHLKRQLGASTREIDLGDIIAQLQAPTTDAINTLLIEAVDSFNSRDFLAAKERVEQVLIDLPGHQEARDLRDQIEKSLKIESQVGQFLVQAREALAAGDPQEAANFVMMAQALDPHHTGIASTLKEIDETGGLALAQMTDPAPADAQQPPPAAKGPPQRAASSPGRGAEPTQGSPFQDQSDEADAFAVEFDTTDPFADLIETGPERQAEGPPLQAAAFETDDFDFSPGDDTDDLFSAPGEMSGFGGDNEPGSAAGAYQPAGVMDTEDLDEDSIATTIQSLVERGEEALGDGDAAQAISIWSRIFLIKPSHPEAGHLIERAKKRLAATQAELDELVSSVRDAYDADDFDAANLLVSKALALRPGDLEATLLKEEIDRDISRAGGRKAAAQAGASSSAGAARSPAPELPELDDDLFGDVDAAIPAAAAMDVSAAIPEAALDDDLFDHEIAYEDLEPLSLLDRVRSRGPLHLAIIAAVGLIVVLAGVWMGSRLLSSEPEVDESARVNEVLLEADRLYRERKVEEALHVLREFPASGLFKQRIDMRIAKYEESLAPPTPTPIPEDAIRAEQLFEQGLWWSAFVTANAGLAAHPDDPGLVEIRRQVLEVEPEAEVLAAAVRNRDFRTAVSLAEDLVQRYPEQGDLRVVLERSLFNAALAEARAYNLTGSENNLERLLELKPGDEEAVRFLEFVTKYKVRAADMRLEIFIRSLEER